MTQDWLEKEINLTDKHSLHLRPAQRIVEIASKFKSDVRACKDTVDLNAKSILDMIEFAAYMARNTDPPIPITPQLILSNNPNPYPTYSLQLFLIKHKLPPNSNSTSSIFTNNYHIPKPTQSDKTADLFSARTATTHAAH